MNASNEFAVFAQHESEVRSYCRSFPAVFARAKGPFVYTSAGLEYIDFFAGAGTLNYGHNPDAIKQKLLDYLARDGISHGLDFFTEAKREFIAAFHQQVLAPKGLDYKLQFCGPTGANAVEAALKLARKVTGRQGVFSFMGGYHGLSLGSLAATANRSMRAAAGTGLHDVSFMPYPDGRMVGVDSLAYIEYVLSDSHSGFDKPAAIVMETTQAEGGIVVAPDDWLRGLRALCDRHGIVLVCDDIQVGCHRTGPFFSFERAGIKPDIVALSKSISGYGLPMSLVLIKPEFDRWKPGEHTGTFRGNQLAFVGGTAALALAAQLDVPAQVQRKAQLFDSFFQQGLLPLDARLQARGIGMVWGLDCAGVDTELAGRVSRRCFELGLIIETAGRGGSVLKFLPPLTTPDDVLQRGLAIVERALKDCLHG
jgi:diaminobutyrate-2-oxoglutarate transaminase